ncbi:YdbH domain-containing protein [Parvibaculum sp.]|uniref:YdbH domain-containing protein n=1 Tax=Parvibaculum sp. TaxID=2024848 RepID=UPI002D01B1E6|nr:YdbH domain-containing protein [Parvibaculum sp.]HUD49965.1 YdbH domain-containing protein [Parvibaculum sp.]
MANKNIRRRLLLAGLGLVAVLLVGAGILWQTRIGLAERAIANALAARGIAPVSFHVSLLGLRSIEVGDLAIGPSANGAEPGPDVEADRISIMYRFGELLSGRVQSIEVSGLRVRARIDDRGLSLGAASSLLEQGGTGGAAGALPDIHIDGARIEIATPQGPFAIEGQLDISKAGATAPIAISVPALRLFDRSASIRFQPVDFTGRADLDGQRLTLGATARSTAPGSTGVELAKISGDYDLAAAKGAARVSGALVFAPGKLEPQTVLPVLKGLATNVGGKLTYRADFTVSAGQMGSSGEVVLTGIGFEAYTAKIGGLTGPVKLASLMPPRTRGPQTLSVGLVQAGFPLKDGRVTFDIGKTGVPHLVDATWPFADGKLTLASTSSSSDRFELTAENVEVAALLALVDVPGLSGSGTLSGKVPVRIENGNPIVEGGNLAAMEGGVIVYKSAAAEAATGSEQTKLLTDALKDFHYTELVGTLDGNVNGDLQFRLRLKGANPALYNGYPIVLNVNLQGSLADLIRRGTVGLRPMELIRSEVAPQKVAPQKKETP